MEEASQHCETEPNKKKLGQFSSVYNSLVWVFSMTWLLITAQGRTATSWCPPSSSTLCPSWRPPGSRPASRAGSPCRWGPEAAPSPPPSAGSFVSCILTIRKNHAASYWCFCKRFSILKKKMFLYLLLSSLLCLASTKISRCPGLTALRNTYISQV